MKFIQIGNWLISVDHIAAINLLNARDGSPCVALCVIGDDEPWHFAKESEEAKALVAWAMRNTKVLVGFEQPGGAQ